MRRLLTLALALLPLLLYAPALDGGFVSDDHRFIAANSAKLADWARPWVYFTDPDANATPPDPDIYRPLRTWSFALDFALAGAAPLLFHVHNVLLHGAAAALLFRLLLGTFRGAVGPAFAAAFVFAAHPIQTEAVAWISSRADLQAAVLALLALLAARRAEGGGGSLVATAVFAALAGFAKEPAVLVPLLYLIERRLRTGLSLRGALRPLAALAVGAAVYLAIYLAVRARGIAGQVDWYGGSPAAHLPYALVGLARLLRLFLLPVGQNFIWEPMLFHPLAPADVALAALGAGAALAAVLWLCRRSPAIGFGAAWFAVAFLPSANVLLPLRTVLAERFAYLPFAGVAIAVGGAFVLAGHAPRARAAVAMLVALALTGATVHRAAAWQSERSLYSATLRDHPRSYSATLGLASLAGRDGDFAEAALLYRLASERAAGDPVAVAKAAYGLGDVLRLAGDLPGATAVLQSLTADLDSGRIPEAAFDLAPEARYLFAFVLSQQRELSAAARALDALIERHGATAARLDARGEIERARFDVSALEWYGRALELDPNYHEARIHRATIFAASPGLSGEAVRELREVIARDPGNEKARELLRQLGK